MVARATRRLAEAPAPSLARPMLQSAAAAAVDHKPLEAAIRLREALRRVLAAECRSQGLTDDGSPQELWSRLDGSDMGACFLILELLDQLEDVLSFREPPRHVGRWIELAFGLIEEDRR